MGRIGIVAFTSTANSTTVVFEMGTYGALFEPNSTAAESAQELLEFLLSDNTVRTEGRFVRQEAEPTFICMLRFNEGVLTETDC